MVTVTQWQSPFTIDVLVGGVKVGGGPLTTVVSCDTKNSLDLIGELSFSLPASDPRAALAASGAEFDVYDEQEGYLGRYVFTSSTITERQGVAMKTVRAASALIELTRETSGFKRRYTYHDVGQVVTELAGLAGWTVEADANIGFTTLTLEGESPFRGIDELRDRFKQHFRVKTGSTNILEFGAFGENSGVRLTNLSGNFQSAFAQNSQNAIVTSVQVSEDAEQIFNRIIALGAGQGEAQITMLGATAGTYSLETGVNQDGTLYYYIEDAASIAAYGLRVKILTLSNIRPVSNSDDAIALAADALKLSAEAYLARNKDPRLTYDVEVEKLPLSVRVGDQVRLVYREVREGEAYLDVDEMFYVLEISRQRSATGQRSVSILISETGERRTSDQDVVIDTVKSLNALKMHVQPYPYWSENTYYDTIAGGATLTSAESLGVIATAKRAKFKLEIDNSVTFVTKVRIRFRTQPLWAPYIAQLVAGPVLTTAWVLVLSPNYPKYIALFINDVDVSAQVGGPWNTSYSNVAIEETIDITSIITGAVGGVYQQHSIELRCLELTGNATAVGGTGTFSANVSTGIVEMNIRVQGVTQSTIPE